MSAVIARWFSGDGFMPHGMCYLWRSDVLTLHVVSDGLITLSYFSIPFTLIYFVRKRRDLEFHWMFLCFAVFIVACGATHLMEIWVIWHPAYWLSGAIKAVTALASVPTAVLLVRLIPNALQLPSPSALRVANVELEHEIAERQRAVAEVQRINEELEARVRERTLELEESNHSLRQEVRERQRAEQSLRQSETHVRAVLNASPNAVVAINKQGIIIEWNPRAEAMFGWRRDEALGRAVKETIIPERYRALHTQGMAHYLETGEGPVLDRVVELNAVRRDGREFPVELSISPLTTDESVTFCGFVTDITERKQAQTKLHTQVTKLSLLQRITRGIGERQDLNSIYQLVIDSLEENFPADFACICSYLPATQILVINNVGKLSTMLALELAMTEQTRIAIGKNGLERLTQAQMICEADIGKLSFPILQRLASGGLNALVFVPLVAEGRVVGALLVARCAVGSFDAGECEFLHQLSEHVALAAHQAQLYTTLQQTYEELRQSQHSLLQQERLRALGQMASGVAHDINNAISPVALYTEALLEQELALSERVRNYLVTIRRAIEDVSLTVDRMREFYRPQDSHATLTPVDLNNLVRHVIDLTRARWRDQPQQRGIAIELRTELSEQSVKTTGAENEIRDALTNLIFNAVDAMPNGGTLILRTHRLRTGRGDNSKFDDQAVVEVIDTGVGMDEKTRHHCLEPFFTTKGEHGTGLGLAMVYGMAQRHGAKLLITSAVGKGTTMRLEFPLAGDAGSAVVNAPSEGGVLRCLRLLLVDDDSLIIESLGDVLQRDGHQVTTAGGGQQGIEAFIEAHKRASNFDVVITDLGMPYVDGRRVAAAVKAVSPHTPVIMLTGWGQRLLADNEIPPHVDRLLTKPPKLEALRQALALVTAIKVQPRA